MAVSVDQFGKAIVASGLMKADELKTLWAAIPAAERPKNDVTFARLLRDRSLLNEFQAEELLSGRNTPLILGDYVLLSKIGAGGMGQGLQSRAPAHEATGGHQAVACGPDDRRRGGQTLST